MPEHKRREFEATSEADFGYTLAGVGRFRVNVFRQRSMVGLAIRRVRSEVPTVDELMLPPVIAELADSSRGLVLVTGPTGTGKTTTIASMIGHINRTRRAHIVTIEDPIEVVHDDDRSIIQQREVGLDTDSYAAALRHVVRQDPDVIFVGEIRDPESALSAIQAAETGHLVISTLHTIDCDRDDQPAARPVPRPAAAGGPHVVRRRAPRDRVAAPRDAGRRQGARPRGRGARLDRPCLRPDHRPRGDDRDPRRHRRGRLLRHADVRPGARRPRRGRSRDGGGCARSPRRARTTSCSRSAGRSPGAKPASSRFTGPRPPLGEPRAPWGAGGSRTGSPAAGRPG